MVNPLTLQAGRAQPPPGQQKENMGKTINKYIYRMGKELPYGVERTVLRILQNCAGHERAVQRDYIYEQIKRLHGVDIDDRTLRKILEKIRSRGIRAVDFEDGSGLFIAETEEEYQAFRARYGAHAFTQLKVIRAMDKGIPVEGGEDLTRMRPIPQQMELEV